MSVRGGCLTPYPGPEHTSQEGGDVRRTGTLVPLPHPSPLLHPYGGIFDHRPTFVSQDRFRTNRRFPYRVSLSRTHFPSTLPLIGPKTSEQFQSNTYIHFVRDTDGHFLLLWMIRLLT